MTRKVIPLTFTMTIEVDADDADKLPEQDGILAKFGEGQAPIPGINDLGNRITDACIKEAFKYFTVMRVHAVLDDALCVVGERKDEENLTDWFY